MRVAISRLTFNLFLVAGSCWPAFSQTAPPPLSASEVLALQVGAALPENIAHDVRTRGLKFIPDEQLLASLKRAGASPALLTAVRATAPSAGAKGAIDHDLFNGLLQASDLMRRQEYDKAEAQLTQALTSSFAAPETAFVMAEVLRQQESFGQAASVYGEMLRQWPDFPEVHTKASYVLYRMGDSEDALSEARVALKLNPDDAEAHKNAGLALDDERKFDAAAAEYREALRIKPDYAAVHCDLGLLLFHMNSFDQSIAEYKKAIELNPNDADFHSNLGAAYEQVNDFGDAIAENREAQRLRPNDPDIRQNLASALMNTDPTAAIAELRETEKLFPDLPMCHVCLGNALVWADDIKGAQAEYEKAEALDPTAYEPHRGMGKIQEQQKNYDDALDEYRKAEQLAPDEARTHQDVGRVLIAKKDFANADSELKQAVDLQPSSWELHELYGQALSGEGQATQAIAEFKESIALDPKEPQVMDELGSALEKQGDWATAMQQYQDASRTHRQILSSALVGETVREYGPDPDEEYKKAQERFEQHINQMKAEGKNQQAADLEKQVHSGGAADQLAQSVQSALDDGVKALGEHRYSDSERSFQQAVTLAQNLPASDPTLVTAMGALANAYGMASDYPHASEVAHREIEVIEKTNGPASPQTVRVLYFLGALSVRQHDFTAGQTYFERALEINIKHFGENDGRTSDTLRAMAGFYMQQQDWPHAETYLLRAVKAQEASAGATNGLVLVPLWGLCSLYDTWGRPEKSQPCWQHAVEIADSQPDHDTGDLAPALKLESAALRRLGRNSEADQLDLRLTKLHPVASSQ